MLTNLLDIQVWKGEDGDDYCYSSDIPQRIRDFAHERGQTWFVNDREVCSVEAVVTYSTVSTPLRILA